MRLAGRANWWAPGPLRRLHRRVGLREAAEPVGRDEILAAGTRLLLETGDEEAVSIRAIAQAVGVTPPSIYLHFADKTELIYAICGELFRTLDHEMAAAAAGVDDPLEELRRRGRAYVRFGLENAEAYRVLFMHHKDEIPETVDPRSWATRPRSCTWSRWCSAASTPGSCGPPTRCSSPWGCGCWSTASPRC
jgi:AcrR family transcriptional regulator